MVSVLWMEQKALKAATLPVALPAFPIFRSLGLGPEQSRGPSRGPSPRKGRAGLGGMSKSVTSFRTKPPHFGHDRSFGCWYRRQDVSVLRTLFPSHWNSRHDEQSASRFLRRLLGGLLSTAAWEQEGALPWRLRKVRFSFLDHFSGVFAFSQCSWW